MMKQNVRRHPLWWLLPLGLALPFAACTAWVVLTYGSEAKDLMDIVLKMVVIP